MKLTHKQRLIVAYIREHGSVTVEQCQSIPGVNTYYCNSAKHCGNLLRTMQKAGYLERVKKGLYRIPEVGTIRPASARSQTIEENQKTLF